ncbi:MAG: hypothetical protein M1824_000859 [Vezdaea acicularis]|nr:MAG: hypothetical protein M1824_000859 [Vezdaea acicularis]
MQLHAVPEDERALDENGKRKPYAEISSRASTSKTVEEWGPFGTSKPHHTKARSATPAKKTDSSLEGFEEAWSKTLARGQSLPSEDEPLSTSRRMSQSLSKTPSFGRSSTQALTSIDSSATAIVTPDSVQKEPTEVILYGFHADKQWAAIDKYEQIAGRICEDYPRDAPPSQRKYKAASFSSSIGKYGPTTAAESRKTSHYAGGECWIKITFESAAVAERAVALSPVEVYGHVVVAEYYHGAGPPQDVPILVGTPEATKYAKKPSALRSLAPSTSMHTIPRTTSEPPGEGSSLLGSRRSNLGRSHTTSNLNSSSRSFEPPFSDSTSSTSSSATATNGLSPPPPGLIPYPSLSTEPHTLPNSPGLVRQPNGVSKPTTSTGSTTSSEFCTRIPSARRAVLLPAEQALLPQPTWWQRMTAQMPTWFTTDVIGDSVPRKDTGEFDWDKATLWWKVAWWVDSWLGWDTCGLKEE